MVTDGIVKDNKSTSAFAWQAGTRDEEHILQLSLYRWIDAGQKHRKITEDFGMINYIFTDWSKMMAKGSPEPEISAEPDRGKAAAAHALEETEAWIEENLAELIKYQNAPEKDIPHCTDEQLWRSAPQFKYYANPAKTGRSMQNFDNLLEANAHMRNQGKGVVITKPGEVKRCGYCPGFEACTKGRLSMIDLTGITHHPVITEMVDVLCAKTQNTDRGFFNVEAAFFVAKIAATQRAVIVTKDRGEIPGEPLCFGSGNVRLRRGPLDQHHRE